MKRYIFMTYDTHMMGGCQNYVFGKSMYLEKLGWEVYVLYCGNPKNKCPFGYLEKYDKGNIHYLTWLPAQIPSFFQKIAIKEMQQVIGESSKYEKTIIESHDERLALWGELLSQEIGAKHMVFTCNELFRGKNKYYSSYIDFFYFKYLRGELYGICNSSLNLLFKGFYDVPIDDTYVFNASSPDAVQDVKEYKMPMFETSDWNICYFGRSQKKYVNNILRDLSFFAKKYSTKKINFIFIGDATGKKPLIRDLFSMINNVKFYYLGDLVPVPRIIFSYLDVLIAGAGCAFHSAGEGVPIIIPDPENGVANGVYGYDVYSTLYKDGKVEQISFACALENVLVRNIYKNKTIILKPRTKADEQYEKQLSYVEKSADAFAYFEQNAITRKKRMLDITRIKNGLSIIFIGLFRKRGE